MPTVVASAVSPQSATARMLVGAALVALVLAAAGIFGVMAYGVAQRTREFGVRIALGASPGGIVGLVLRQSLRLTAVGIVLGIGAALAMGRAMQAILYQTDAWDPLVIGGVALALGAVALVAGWVPARRALRISPIEALGAE
jgi:ABC-type antimicrobial peptide transport system permease subunit